MTNVHMNSCFFIYPFPPGLASYKLPNTNCVGSLQYVVDILHLVQFNRGDRYPSPARSTMVLPALHAINNATMTITLRHDSHLSLLRLAARLQASIAVKTVPVSAIVSITTTKVTSTTFPTIPLCLVCAGTRLPRSVIAALACKRIPEKPLCASRMAIGGSRSHRSCPHIRSYALLYPATLFFGQDLGASWLPIGGFNFLIWRG
ncbi:hypothetical protein V1507DRAFT_225023 [Lipomyces tetrasporus]